MSKTPTFDAAIEKVLSSIALGSQTCSLSGETWLLTEEDADWFRKFRVPVSRLSPLMRMKMLTGFAIGIEIWWNKHAETGVSILSYIHPDSMIKVVPDVEWHANDYSAVNAEVRVEESFIPQVVELIKQIPLPALRQFIPPTNTVGVTTLGVEDSFMVFAFRGKRTCYAYISMDVDDSVDIVFCRNIQQSHNLMRCFRMHSCYSCFESTDCLRCAFLFDCRNCENCFGGTNLRNKKYIFFNEQLTKEEYERRLSEIDLGSWKTYQTYLAQYHQLVQDQAVWPASFNTGCQESSGEYLLNCVRVKNGYWLNKVTDCNYFWYNVDGGEQHCFLAGSSFSSGCYTCSGVVKSADCKFSTMINGSVDVEYCFAMENCQDCFGCVGLKNKRFCILNKQYDEGSYWQTVDKIKTAMLERGEYGDFFPSWVSPAGFVFTSAVFMAGITPKELDLFKAPRFDPRRGGVVTGEREIEAKPIDITLIPDHIRDMDPTLFVKKPIRDPELDRNFSVLEPEFELYQRLGLPFPRQHFTTRLKALAKLANKPVSEDLTCAQCGERISVAKNETFVGRKVSCERCYLKFMETRG